MVYLDNNATTQLDPDILDWLAQQLARGPQNPSSSHRWGQAARQLITQARATVADLLGARGDEVIFTSGGTEAIQLVLRGYVAPPAHLISSNVEHPAVAQTLDWMERSGWQVTRLEAGSWGAILPEQVIGALQPNTRALVLMAANNETGVVTDLEAMARIAQERSLFFFVDGVAALGKCPISFLPGISALAFSGHKIHAPQGVGVALVRRGIQLAPQLLGGGQESGRRSGTENVVAIGAFARALQYACGHLSKSMEQMARLRDRLQQGLADRLQIQVHGEGPRLCNTLHVSFCGVDAESLLILLDQEGIGVSHGSACSAGALEPSKVLLAMGVSHQLARGAIRFSLSRFTTEAEIDRAIEAVCCLAPSLMERVDTHSLDAQDGHLLHNQLEVAQAHQLAGIGPVAELLHHPLGDANG
jgi:cysteine desulfurase